MKTKAWSALLGLIALLASCNSGGGSGGAFTITSCSLGCAGSGAGSGQVGCGLQDVFINGEIRITFSTAVDEDSLSVFSLQVTEVATGKTPPAFRFVDPDDPRVVIYRPKLTFDSSGSPVFGLTPNADYTIKLPGVAQDADGPYITSAGGTRNQQRMLCTVDASLGVLDVKPGPPNVAITVDKVTGYDQVTGEPDTFAFGVPALGEVDVFRFSPIVFKFNDLMNPATLVNPVTGLSNTISVDLDADGIIADPTDRQPVSGGFTISIDQDALTTTVIFTPDVGYPSAGSDPVNKRQVVITLGASIADLGNNPLANAGVTTFQPETILFTETELNEDFLVTNNEDVTATNADWDGDGTTPGGAVGFLQAGVGGGSGKHGALIVGPGEVVSLNTDSEDFSGVPPVNYQIPNSLDVVFDVPSQTFSHPPITDGIFEFSTIQIGNGGRLRLEGSQPARVFVRGEFNNRGVFDAAGQDNGVHDAQSVFGQVAGEPGPSGGAGGDGGRLPNWVGLETVAGTIIDPVATPPVLAELNGSPGTGVPDNLLFPTGTFGAGQGGLAWPQPGIIPDDPVTLNIDESNFHFPVDPLDILGVDFDRIFFCNTKLKGGTGSGGGYGLSGGASLNLPLVGLGLIPKETPAVPGGGALPPYGIGSDPNSPPRLLNPDLGWLHGGAGAGGGGSHMINSTTNGQIFLDCYNLFGGIPASLSFYAQQSGAAGGAGGGGVQLQAGRVFRNDGVFDVSGAQGGSKDLTGSSEPSGGGGGAGGSALIQSPLFVIANLSGRIDVSGGPGGLSTSNSRGGDGGSGLLRWEILDGSLTTADVQDRVAPSPADLSAVGATPDDVISVGTWVPDLSGPGAFNGAQSCWLRPTGNFFLLNFCDGAGTLCDDVGTLGWDMDVVVSGLGLQSWRSKDFAGLSLEDLATTQFGNSPLVVRFQGARSIKKIDDLCDVTLEGDDSVIFPGSLTGWVDHPADLNTYFSDPSLRPNMFRFQLIMDTTNPFYSLLLGIDEIRVNILPD